LEGEEHGKRARRSDRSVYGICRITSVQNWKKWIPKDKVDGEGECLSARGGNVERKGRFDVFLD